TGKLRLELDQFLRLLPELPRTRGTSAGLPLAQSYGGSESRAQSAGDLLDDRVAQIEQTRSRVREADGPFFQERGRVGEVHVDANGITTRVHRTVDQS